MLKIKSHGGILFTEGVRMKFTLILDKTREEEVLVYAKEKNEITEKIERLVNGDANTVNGYLDDQIVKLDFCDVYCFSIDGGKLYAVCENEKYLLKARLYSIEQLLGYNFIKINQSSIANIGKIARFDASIGGTLKVIFKNGYTDYVSRRNIKSVKERLGL